MYYFLRKNFSVVVPYLNSELGITKSSLGLFMTLHGLLYGLSRFLCGFAVDRVTAKHILISGIFVSIGISLLLGFQSTVIVIGLLWSLNAISQGCGYPSYSKNIN
jgi:OPA family glycerol-3-phosphate transporter-like MFS transporter/OPA family sugar phosphate sensor protein UhpC-like MFS transporter